MHLLVKPPAMCAFSQDTAHSDSAPSPCPPSPLALSTGEQSPAAQAPGTERAQAPRLPLRAGGSGSGRTYFAGRRVKERGGPAFETQGSAGHPDPVKWHDCQRQHSGQGHSADAWSSQPHRARRRLWGLRTPRPRRWCQGRAVPAVLCGAEMAGGAFASRPGACVDRLVALRGLGPASAGSPRGRAAFSQRQLSLRARTQRCPQLSSGCISCPSLCSLPPQLQEPPRGGAATSLVLPPLENKGDLGPTPLCTQKPSSAQIPISPCFASTLAEALL